MQIKPAPASCYRKPRIDETDHPEARRRLAILAKVDAFRARGVSLEVALLAAEVPRSRRPRRVRRPRWTREAERRVWALRRRYPFMGKRRLRVLLAREGVRLSESTVGRIVAKGMRRGRIRPCAFCRGRVTVKQRRRFDGHAQRWRYGQRARQPGELVQIDHLSASRESKQLKEFKAVSPVGKQLVARVYSRATARNAKRFLDAVRADLPHDLLSVQVDGGSEFRAAFEQACEALQIPLHVLPAPPAAVQRLRRARQRHHPGGVLEPLRRRVHRRGRQSRPGRLSTLPQPRPTPPGPRLVDPQRVPSR